MPMISRGTLTQVVFWIGMLTAFGCARLHIPAPDAPVVPAAEPMIEKSVINLPISVSLKSVLGIAGRLSTRSTGSDQTAVLEGMVRNFLTRQAKKIDPGLLLQNFYVRQQARKAWEELSAPVRLTPDLSLQINPEAISLTPLADQDDMMRLVIGITAKPKLTAGAVPAMNDLPIPGLTMTETPSGAGFHIAVDTELSFTYLGSALTKQLKGTSYAVQGGAVTIEQVRVFGSGGSVVLAVDINGPVRGTVYLSGTPVYDEATRTLSVRDPDYTLETKQVLAAAADWILHTRLKEGIAKRSSWFIGGRLDTVRDRLNEALNRDLDHMHVTGTITALRPVSVGVTALSIKAVLVADGGVEITVR